jgi:photosystem II stability/assembly factor-like uncharacterized protein
MTMVTKSWLRPGLIVATAGVLTCGVAPGGAARFVSLDATRLAGLRWRLVGPAHMSGRITDIAVDAARPHTIYVGAASGGAWKSTNNGTTWTPIFDRAGTASVGAIAVSASNPDIVWIGSGEANASSYSPWGDGVYKSTDAGRTWQHMGLRDTHHIGRVVIHPTNPDVVFVAALGHLWGPNRERGLFRTADGGRTWKNVKFISEDVGFVDVAMDPRNPNTLYAAAYGRRSDRFDDFDSVGIFVKTGGGIFASRDGGETWTQSTSGLPSERVGRIGLAVAPNRPATIYAIVEVAPIAVTLSEEEVERLRTLLDSASDPDKAELQRLRSRLADAVPRGQLAAAIVSGLSRTEQAQWRVLLGLEPLDTGGGVFRSNDSGRTWRRTNPLNEREAYYSQIRVDPTNAERVYVLVVRVWLSEDGGRTFEQTPWAMSSFLTSDFIHGDFHAMWINPANPRHVLAGSDGGLYTTYDAGAHWEAHHMPLGQFVGIGVDMQTPYFIYGGLQDNGVWGGPSATRHRSGITDRDWFKAITADGAYVSVDPTDHTRVYAESQYGNLFRLDLRVGTRRFIRPRSRRPDPPLRFNYVAPFALSRHDSSTLYVGAQRLIKSTDRGENWTAISGDLTKGRPTPETSEGATITTLAESPLAANTLWVGTDDGNVQVSKDGGKTWTNVADRVPGLPRQADGQVHTWVSRIETSPFEEGTAFVSFDGHRLDDFNVYLFVTRDFGQSWTSIASNIPSGWPVNVVRADPKNRDLLFAGTETGVSASIDRGRSWLKLDQGLPTVPVEDLLIHPRDGDLIAGTHGRSIFVMDISPLQQLTPEILTSEAHVFEMRRAIRFDVDPTRNVGASGARRFQAPNPYSDLLEDGDGSELAPPGATFYYYLRDAHAGAVKVIVEDAKGRTVRELDGQGTAGLNRVDWNLRGPDLAPLPPWQRVGSNDSRALSRAAARGRPGPLVAPGQYRVTLVRGASRLSTTLHVEPDRAVAGAAPAPAGKRQ